LLGLTVTCARCHDHKFDPIPTRDYYSLYGVFASCADPTVPPLFAEPPRTEAYARFATELQVREQKLTAFVWSKHDELVRLARTRAAEYLLAAHAQRDQPNTEDFMLLADGGDLNPKMIERWRVYLERARKTRHPVFVAWHDFAALPEKDFAARAREMSAAFLLQADLHRPVHPLIAKALADRPPATMAEVARRYGDVLNATERLWQETVRQRPDLKAWPDPMLEELRQVFHGPDSAPAVAFNPYGELDLLPDRPAQATLQELRKAVEQWRATGPGAPPRAMVLEDLPVPHAPRVFLRGSPNNLGEPVPRQFLGVLSGAERQPFRQGSGRLELAAAIVDRKNPLTARVLVNRVWLQHFGAGLVRTPSDFGLRSEPPSHPDLLDYLATSFMESGWSLKHLHRLILLSAVYGQRSDDRSDCSRVDPENVLLWKMNRRRLDFEASRDALLAVSGRLKRMIGGPSVKDITATTANRRTLYGYLDRLNVPGLYRTFDFPSPDATSPQRDATTVPPQALFLMNHPFTLECARGLLRRPEIIGQEASVRIVRLHHLLFGRSPVSAEETLAREFLDACGDTPASWERYAQALLLANELVFLD
jgi:hypothetical protein